jgi:hypothetical protein
MKPSLTMPLMMPLRRTTLAGLLLLEAAGRFRKSGRAFYNA